MTQDVQKAADDVARAARHERRLRNTAAVEPLQAAAQNIQQVANNESADAEKELDSATAEAEQGEAEGQGNQPRKNAEALQAQQAIATAETAIAEQAEQLSGVVEPLLAAAEAAANAQAAQSNEPAANVQEPPTPASGEQTEGQTEGQAEANAPAQGQQTPGTGQPAGGQPTTPSFTPEEMAQAQQLARTLDELDRQQAAAASADGVPPAATPSQQNQPSQLNLDTLAQAAQAQQATMSNQRTQAQQEAVLALGEGGTESAENPSPTGAMTDFEVISVSRDENTEWGKLRGKSAEDLTTGRSEAVSEEYRKSVETYFRVLAERARKKR